MTKADLIACIASDTNLPKAKIELVVNSLIMQLKNSLANGENLTLAGFGTFSTRDRKERTGRNPQTGEPLNIPKKTVPTFKPSQSFKDILNAL
jgi:nucleoid DNA-binding protein